MLAEKVLVLAAIKAKEAHSKGNLMAHATYWLQSAQKHVLLKVCKRYSL